VFSGIGGLIKSAFSGVVDFIQGIVDKFNSVKNAISGAIDKVKSFVGMDKGSAPDTSQYDNYGRRGATNVPGAFNGADILQSGIVKVGERGPELLSLPRGARVAPLDYDKPQPVTSTINNEFKISSLVVREEADVKKVARELFNMQRDNDRGLGLV